MAVVSSDSVDLLFITLDTVGSSDIISIEPGLVVSSKAAA
jgi:hypothetical protein